MGRAIAGNSGRLTSSISFRPESEQDIPFLRKLYSSTRVQEMAQVGWTGEEKESFLTMQFEAQRRHYQAQFPRADYLVVEEDGMAIGRIYVDRGAEEMRLIDITLVPLARNKGLGGALLRDLLDEGRARGTPVRIHVEKFNPAMRLYLRLGFRPIEDRGVYQFLEWLPAVS